MSKISLIWLIIQKKYDIEIFIGDIDIDFFKKYPVFQCFFFKLQYLLNPSSTCQWPVMGMRVFDSANPIYLPLACYWIE